jgi:small subunit ribosomal protein S15
MALDSAKKREIIAKFGNDEKDTGSPAVQIALLTERINQINEHLQEHKHDHSSRLGLLKLVGQRKRLMRYLKRKDHDKYLEVISALNLRDRV